MVFLILCFEEGAVRIIPQLQFLKSVISPTFCFIWMVEKGEGFAEVHLMLFWRKGLWNILVGGFAAPGAFGPL